MPQDTMSDAERLAHVQQLLTSVQTSLGALKTHLDKLSVAPSQSQGDTYTLQRKARDLSVLDEGRVLEGVFDGQHMIGPDGRQYPVPANYASKSKLVEGDILKLTIADDGRFLYKQIGPIARRTAVGTVVRHDGEHKVIVDGAYYRVLLASITFYRMQEGDKVTLLLPVGRDATWAAVDNVVHQSDATSTDAMSSGSSDLFFADAETDEQADAQVDTNARTSSAVSLPVSDKEKVVASLSHSTFDDTHSATSVLMSDKEQDKRTLEELAEERAQDTPDRDNDSGELPGVNEPRRAQAPREQGASKTSLGTDAHATNDSLKAQVASMNMRASRSEKSASPSVAKTKESVTEDEFALTF